MGTWLGIGADGDGRWKDPTCVGVYERQERGGGAVQDACGGVRGGDCVYGGDSEGAGGRRGSCCVCRVDHWVSRGVWGACQDAPSSHPRRAFDAEERGV